MQVIVMPIISLYSSEWQQVMQIIFTKKQTQKHICKQKQKRKLSRAHLNKHP